MISLEAGLVGQPTSAHPTCFPAAPLGAEKESGIAQNALLAAATKSEIVGLTVDDDVRRIIARYGAEAVKASVKVQTKPKRGRKPEKDWPLLWPYIERDAVEWLSCGDPFKKWTDWAIANSYADENCSQSHSATVKCTFGRLKASRRPFVLYEAERNSRHDPPTPRTCGR
jgi:hypothetical protein